MPLQRLIAECLSAGESLPELASSLGRWEPWLQPLESDSDAVHEDDFQQLRAEINKTSGGDARRVIELAERLSTTRTKDVRVLTYYLWARVHNEGMAGLADGLTLLAAMLERFAAGLLPSRPSSRRAALEWLGSSKVLDALDLHPEALKADTQRAVAALVWLAQLLASWPPEQQPAPLTPLYAALSRQLAQAGGVDALVPQTTVQGVRAPVPVAAAVQSGREVLERGRALASYLRDQPEGWLAAHRLMTALRWDTVHQAPLLDGAGNTRLAPPRSEYRAQLRRLQLRQAWGEILEEVERLFAEGVHHFWLDLQCYLCQALAALGGPQAVWGDIVKRDLGMFLERVPGLETLRWSDGSAFADPATQDWIAAQVNGNQPGQWLAAPVASPSADVLALESEALEQADSGGVEAALAWLAERPEVQGGRARWQLRLVMARVAEQHGKADLALHLLSELDASAQRLGVTDWEPPLSFEVKARLLKLLRSKAQRSDADKPALAARTETLLADLVALDPVRAAVLCG